MYNYYIDENSYKNSGVTNFANNMSDLIYIYSTLVNKQKEFFYKNDTLLWTIVIENGKTISECLFMPQMRRFKGADIRTLQQIKSNQCIHSFANLKSKFPFDVNASWGINFNPKRDDNLTNLSEYETFRKRKAIDRILTTNFKDFEKFVFKKIVFCPDVYGQIASLDKNSFSIILPDLIKLDSYNEQWKSGHCAAAIINKIVGLNISEESDSVNNDPKLRGKRFFKLPDGRTEYFEMHIKKSSGLRIHIFADDAQKQIYVGYIGTHLQTAKNK